MQTKGHRLFWDWRGRISRRFFWFGQATLWPGYLLLSAMLGSVAGYHGTLLLSPVMLWALAVLMIKRLRDRGKSAAWLALLLLPVLGPVWCLIDLGLLPGKPIKHHTLIAT